MKTKKKTDAEIRAIMRRAWTTVVEEKRQRETRPWRYFYEGEDEWTWGDTQLGLIKAAYVEVEYTEGELCPRLVVDFHEMALDKILSDCADVVADYILENPELYGLTRLSEEASNG